MVTEPDKIAPVASTTTEAPKKAFEFPAAFAAVIALTVAALAAVGVSGGVLVRAVRNAPGTIALIFCLVVTLVAIVSAKYFLAEKKRTELMAVIAIAVAILVVILIGAASIDDRDKPSLSASASTTSTTTTIKVKAQGSGLRSNEDMLVQVTALNNSFPETRSQYFESGEQCAVSRYNLDSPASGLGPLLTWSQAGPSADGTALVEAAVDVPAGRYTGVCVLAVYRGQNNRSAVEASFDALEYILGRPTGDELKLSQSFVQFVS